MIIRRLVIAILMAAPLSAQRVEHQDFDDRQIAHPFFDHVLEYDLECCWRIGEHAQLKSYALYLVPNSDVIALRTAPGEVVESISITILDYEGGFVGFWPTSAVVVRGLSGDFVVLHASQIGMAENVSANRFMPGQLTGEPIGPIFEINLQAANEGNSIFPTEVGAYFDDLSATVLDACVGDLNFDRVIDLTDLTALLANFGMPQDATFSDGDFDGDGDVDLSDLAAQLAAFGQSCA